MPIARVNLGNRRSGRSPDAFTQKERIVNVQLPEEKETFIYDHAGRVLTKVTTVDVEPIIENALHYRNNLRNGFTKSGEMRLIGTIPMAVIDMWFRQGFNPFRGDPDTGKEIKRRLNEFNKFRTVDGAL